MVLWCFLLVGLLLLGSAHGMFKLCLVMDNREFGTLGTQCAILHERKSEFQCSVGIDKMDCLRQVSEGIAHFGIFDAEELLVAAENDQFQEIFITHKLHPEKDFEFGVVAIVSDTANITNLSNLRGKRLCHPGTDPAASRYDWNEIFNLYFEDLVVQQDCRENLSVEENRIKSLADFFGDSCRPGVWSPVPLADAALKANYSKLCSLCDIPGECSSNDKYWGRQGSLFCLSDCLGDIAWSRLDDAQYHFSKIANLAVCGNVSLLCPDGRRMSIDAEDPCIWIGRPNSVIAAHRQKAQGVQKALFEIFNTTSSLTRSQEYIAIQHLLNVLHGAPLTVPLTSPRDYLEEVPGYLSANSIVRCGEDKRSIRICTNTDRKTAKCEWLKVAAKSYGVEPSITCVPSTNCFDSVAKNLSDVVTIETDDLFTAVRDYGLEPVLVQNSLNAKDDKFVSIIVKVKSGFNSLSDLRGKNACFTTFEGHGYNSFVLALKEAKLLDPVCPYSQAVSNFFDQICFTDSRRKDFPYKNMRYCTVDGMYVINGTFEPIPVAGPKPLNIDKLALAFQCVATGGGDFAVISKNIVKMYSDKIIPRQLWSLGLESKNFGELCVDNKTPGCYLSWASFGQVMVNKHLNKIKKADIISAFSYLDNVFGNEHVPSHETFEIFSKFEEFFDTLEDDFLKIETRLELNDHFLKKAPARPKNYELRIHELTKCVVPESSSSRTYIKIYLIIAGLFFVFLRY